MWSKEGNPEWFRYWKVLYRFIKTVYVYTRSQHARNFWGLYGAMSVLLSTIISHNCDNIDNNYKDVAYL